MRGEVIDPRAFVIVLIVPTLEANIAAVLAAHEDVGVAPAAISFDVDRFGARLHVGAVLLDEPPRDVLVELIQRVTRSRARGVTEFLVLLGKVRPIRGA